MATHTTMIPRQTIATIVQAYNDATARVSQAFVLLDKAKQLLHATLGEYNDHVLPHHCTDYDLPKEAEKSVANIHKRTWSYLIQQTGLDKFASRKRREETKQMIDQGKAPPLTVANVCEILENIRSSADAIVKEAAREVFEWLRPQHQWGTDYQTNKKNRRLGVPKKIIQEWAMDTWGLSHRTAERLQDLDNLFSLLDGRGVVQYPSDSNTKIREAKHRGLDTAETVYFRFKWYKKGTLHIELKRDDLRQQLALLVHDKTLTETEKERT